MQTGQQEENSGQAVGKPCRLAGIEAHALLDELVLYVSGRELGVSLNRSARAIWELCDGQHTPLEISQELSRALDCPDDELLADVEAAIRQLRELGLVEMV
jgi:hypothetical protein